MCKDDGLGEWLSEKTEKKIKGLLVESSDSISNERLHLPTFGWVSTEHSNPVRVDIDESWDDVPFTRQVSMRSLK